MKTLFKPTLKDQIVLETVNNLALAEKLPAEEVAEKMLWLNQRDDNALWSEFTNSEMAYYCYLQMKFDTLRN